MQADKEVHMSKVKFSILSFLAAILIAPAGFARPAAAADTTQYNVPAGTKITIRMIDAVDSKRARPGDEFAATVADPVVVGDRVVIPKGAEATTCLVEAKTSGRIKGRSELVLQLTQLTVEGQNYTVDSALYTAKGASRGKRSAKMIGGGAGLGALVGALAGGGKGAAIGAGVGAGAGTAVEASTHGQQVKVPSEAKVEFTLRSSLTISK
jgi:hypothetical protein